MTVPTNNEEARDRVVEFVRQYRINPSTGDVIINVWFDPEAKPATLFASDLDALTARRLPVSGDNAELIAKIDRVEPTWPRGMYGCPQDMYGATVIVPLLKEITAALSASQPREAAPSDSDRALKAERLRQLAESYRMDLKSPSTAAMLDDAADTLSRTSHPVQVEVTEAAFDRFVQSFNGDEAGDIDDVWALDGATGWAMRGGNDVRAVFEKAVAALGGGE